MKEILGNSVLILGYGREGKSTHQYLLKHCPEKKIGIADQAPIEPLYPAAAIYVGKEYLKAVTYYDVIIRSPGIPLQLPELQAAVKSGKKITSATNIFFSECPGMIIGITGTKGKSTTTSLIAQILEKKYPDVRLVGNIGLPALDYLSGANKETIFVAELSSHQLEDIHYSPHIAVVLNIVPEHLDRYGNFSNYVKAKSQIVRYQTPEDIVIFNPSHKIVARLASISPARKYRFSLKRQEGAISFLDYEDIFIKEEGDREQFLMRREEIPLLGEGNVENALAAITTGLILNVPLGKIREAVSEFKPLPHRLEFVGEYKGIRFYNDSLSTIPQTTIHALKALGDDVETLIAGGFDRGLDFSELGEFIKKTKLSSLILFPNTGERIWETVAKVIPKEKLPQRYDVTSMEEAVQIAYKITSPGKICLLSPASPSFGIFRDYEERGNLFKELVRKFGQL